MSKQTNKKEKFSKNLA